MSLKLLFEVVHDHRMQTIMELEQLTTLEAISQFLKGTQAVAFSVATHKQERYHWVHKILGKHHYMRLNKLNKGLITCYLMKVTGYSL